MRVRGEVINPQQVQVRVTMDATYSEWERIIAQLPSTHPSWVLASGIRDVLNKTLGSIASAHNEQAG